MKVVGIAIIVAIAAVAAVSYFTPTNMGAYIGGLLKSLALRPGLTASGNGGSTNQRFKGSENTSASTLPTRNGYESSGFTSEYPRVTIGEVREAGRIVFNGTPPKDKALAVWRIMVWVDRHIKYNFTKEELALSGLSQLEIASVSIQTPMETIKRGSGICVDYAVLISALLIYAGVDSYILLINDKAENVSHAVAVGVIRGVPFVLDQHPPPVSFQDYYEYLMPKNALSKSVLYHIVVKGNVLTPEAVGIPKSWLTDDYPADTIPSNLSIPIMKYLQSHYGVIADRGLETLIRCNYSVINVSTDIEELSSFKNDSYVSISKVYSPLFRREYAALYAKYLHKYVLRRRSLHAWIEIHRNSILVAYASVPSPKVRIKVEGSTVTLEIRSTVPYRNASVLYYNPRTGAVVAGVLPNDMYYRGIETINALTWSYTNEYLNATWVQPRNLSRMCIAVLINNEGVYAYCPGSRG